MNTQSNIAQSIIEVPFADCYLSALNPRQEVDEAAIETLSQNIRALGLIQNLVGLGDEDGKVGIVGGGRRLRALSLLQDDPRFATVPVKLAPDAETAAQWAASENHQREALHPADEIASYAALSEQGATVLDIALAFGVGERHVYRRLALAKLPKQILQALREDKITLAMATAFTVANDEQHAFEVLERCKKTSLSERQIKSLLQPDTVASSDRRAVFVGRETYEKAGGRITADLFGENDFWVDVGLLDDLFAQKLIEAAKSLQAAEGWRWVEVREDSYFGYYDLEQMKLERLYPEPEELSEEEVARLEALHAAAELDDLSKEEASELEALEAKQQGQFTILQRAHSGVVAYVQPDGHLQTYRGLVRPADVETAIEAGVLAKSHHTGSESAKPSFSAALQRDMGLVAQGARQSAALAYPDVLIDLLTFQLSGQAGYEHVFALRGEDVTITPTTETGYSPEERLSVGEEGKSVFDRDVATAFKAFRKQSKAKRKQALTLALSRLIDPSYKVEEMLDGLVKSDVRSVWTPTAENFFKRVKADKLNAYWVEFTGLADNHPSVTTFMRLKKRERAEKLEALFASSEMQDGLNLSKAQRQVLNTWVPDLSA